MLDNGLKVFSSTKFGHHEDEVAEVDGNYYKLYHNKIYKTDAAGTLNMHEEHPTNVQPLDFSITKVVAQMLLAAVILILIAFATRGSYKNLRFPSGIARFIEPLIIFVRDEIALQNIGSVKYKEICSLFSNAFPFHLVDEYLRITSGIG